MKKSQKIILWSAGVIMALMLLFPPWTFTYRLPQVGAIKRPAYYSFFLVPAQVEHSPWVKDGYEKNLLCVHMDIPKILTQWVGICLVTGTLVLALHNRKES